MSQPSMDVGSIAIVEDEPVVRRLMRLWLEADGYTVVEYSGGREAAQHDTEGTAAVCLDLRLEDMPGQSVLAELRARDPDLPVIVVTGDQDLETAVQAMRAGAYDYVAKPFDRERLGQAVKRAVERRQLLASVQKLKRELDDRGKEDGLEGAPSEPSSGLRISHLPSPPVQGIGASAGMGEAGLVTSSDAEPFDSATLNLREIERTAIARALKLSGGSVGKAAKLLGIGRATLYRRLSEQRSGDEPAKLNGHEIARP